MTAVSASSALRPALRTRRGSDLAKADAAVRTGSGVALWLSLLLVTYWWAAGGGIQDLAGWQSGLTSVGRVTGLVSSDLLLCQVLLIARLPLIERAFGQDRLLQIHRLVGFTSFNLMLAHVVLITWGYAAGELTSTPGTLWTLTTDYPGMLLALGGTACLVMTVLTSIRAARRRLRYESWHLLHLYAYLGVGLARSSWPPPRPPCTGGASGPSPPVPCWSGGSRCRCGAAPGTGCASPPSSRKGPASPRST